MRITASASLSAVIVSAHKLNFRRKPVIEKHFNIFYNSAMEYKVIETSLVTDGEIEKILNHWVAQGYRFDSIHFVVNESSRRPGMAFVFFTKVEHL